MGVPATSAAPLILNGDDVAVWQNVVNAARGFRPGRQPCFIRRANQDRWAEPRRPPGNKDRWTGAPSRGICTLFSSCTDRPLAENRSPAGGACAPIRAMPPERSLWLHSGPGGSIHRWRVPVGLTRCGGTPVVTDAADFAQGRRYPRKTTTFDDPTMVMVSVLDFTRAKFGVDLPDNAVQVGETRFVHFFHQFGRH